MATRSNCNSASIATSDLDFDRRPFLEHIRVDHGPVHLLGRFFLLADTIAKSLGVSLQFASMHDLVTANRLNGESWRPLLPHYDPAYGGINSDNTFCVLGVNAGGEVVATQAARLYTLTDSNLPRGSKQFAIVLP